MFFNSEKARLKVKKKLCSALAGAMILSYFSFVPTSLYDAYSHAEAYSMNPYSLSDDSSSDISPSREPSAIREKKAKEEAEAKRKAQEQEKAKKKAEQESKNNAKNNNTQSPQSSRQQAIKEDMEKQKAEMENKYNQAKDGKNSDENDEANPSNYSEENKNSKEMSTMILNGYDGKELIIDPSALNGNMQEYMSSLSQEDLQNAANACYGIVNNEYKALCENKENLIRFSYCLKLNNGNTEDCKSVLDLNAIMNVTEENKESDNICSLHPSKYFDNPVLKTVTSLFADSDNCTEAILNLVGAVACIIPGGVFLKAGSLATKAGKAGNLLGKLGAKAFPKVEEVFKAETDLGKLDDAEKALDKAKTTLEKTSILEKANRLNKYGKYSDEATELLDEAKSIKELNKYGLKENINGIKNSYKSELESLDKTLEENGKTIKNLNESLKEKGEAIKNLDKRKDAEEISRLKEEQQAIKAEKNSLIEENQAIKAEKNSLIKEQNLKIEKEREATEKITKDYLEKNAEKIQEISDMATAKTGKIYNNKTKAGLLLSGASSPLAENVVGTGKEMVSPTPPTENSQKIDSAYSPQGTTSAEREKINQIQQKNMEKAMNSRSNNNQERIQRAQQASKESHLINQLNDDRNTIANKVARMSVKQKDKDVFSDD